MFDDKFKEVWFYFKSVEPDHKYLSNFQHIPGGINVMMPDFENKLTFNSIELAFHAMKYYFCNISPEKSYEYAKKLSVLDPEGKTLQGVDQKTVGSKGSFKRLGLSLDISRWNLAMPCVMTYLVQARALVDKKYVEICRDIIRRGYTIRHWTRMKNYRSKNGELVGGRDLLGGILEDMAKDDRF